MTPTFAQLVDMVLSDPSTSVWLREALFRAFDRDPVDALGDAEALSQLLHKRLDSMLDRSLADAQADEQALKTVILRHQKPTNPPSLL